MKAAIYARCSTEQQETENQVMALESWAKQRGFELVFVYRENQSAWRNGHQSELKRLTDDARKGRFQVVLIWSLDRLSREGSTAILNLIDRLKPVRVISYQESWTEAPGELGELLFAIAGWVARMESERRSERTKAGLARAVREGKKLGRPKGSKDTKKRNKRGYLLRYAGLDLREKYG
jgi:putative DNA-invertase from lambdoid prophage Rac